MLGEYLPVFIYFVVIFGTGVLMVIVSHAFQIRVKADKYDWSLPYECGIITEGLRMHRYSIHYYLVGILFVIFDVETVFMIPWAVVGQEFKAADLTAFWLIEMLVFFIILVVGYIYLLSGGVFNWGREQSEIVKS